VRQLAFMTGIAILIIAAGLLRRHPDPQNHARTSDSVARATTVSAPSPPQAIPPLQSPSDAPLPPTQLPVALPESAEALLALYSTLVGQDSTRGDRERILEALRALSDRHEAIRCLRAAARMEHTAIGAGRGLLSEVGRHIMARKKPEDIPQLREGFKTSGSAAEQVALAIVLTDVRGSDVATDYAHVYRHASDPYLKGLLLLNVGLLRDSADSRGAYELCREILLTAPTPESRRWWRLAIKALGNNSTAVPGNSVDCLDLLLDVAMSTPLDYELFNELLGVFETNYPSQLGRLWGAPAIAANARCGRALDAAMQRAAAGVPRPGSWQSNPSLQPPSLPRRAGAGG
jgi:hypothetical protein